LECGAAARSRGVLASWGQSSLSNSPPWFSAQHCPYRRNPSMRTALAFQSHCLLLLRSLSPPLARAGSRFDPRRLFYQAVADFIAHSFTMNMGIRMTKEVSAMFLVQSVRDVPGPHQNGKYPPPTSLFNRNGALFRYLSHKGLRSATNGAICASPSQVHSPTNPGFCETVKL